jgi:hypothetical protein
LAKAVPRQLALQALSRAVADPAPKVLYGSKAKPGIFDSGAAPAKQAGQYCLDHGWLHGTGQFEGKGKSRKELYRITPAGVREVLENSEPVALLRDAADYLERNALKLEAIKSTVEGTLHSLHSQKEMVNQLLDRLKPPDLGHLQRTLAGESAPPASVPAPARQDWLNRALEDIADYQRRNPYGHCPLPELYRQVGGPAGLTIGQFHDGLRPLVNQGQVRLHPFTGAAYQLQDEQFALVAGQEIKYYAERLAGS